MARRRIRKRRHRYWPSFAEMMNQMDAEHLAMAADYEQWFFALADKFKECISEGQP